MQIDVMADRLAFVSDPSAKQNATKGKRGEWRAAGFYNAVYRVLLIEQEGRPFTSDDELPDPTNIREDDKSLQPAIRRVKDMLATVGQAVMYTHRAKDIPMEKKTERLAVQADPKFPAKFKKLLATETSVLWQDVSYTPSEYIYGTLR